MILLSNLSFIFGKIFLNLSRHFIANDVIKGYSMFDIYRHINFIKEVIVNVLLKFVKRHNIVVFNIYIISELLFIDFITSDDININKFS